MSDSHFESSAVGTRTFISYVWHRNVSAVILSMYETIQVILTGTALLLLLLVWIIKCMSGLLLSLMQDVSLLIIQLIQSRFYVLSSAKSVLKQFILFPFMYNSNKIKKKILGYKDIREFYLGLHLNFLLRQYTNLFSFFSTLHSIAGCCNILSDTYWSVLLLYKYFLIHKSWINKQHFQLNFPRQNYTGWCNNFYRKYKDILTTLLTPL